MSPPQLPGSRPQAVALISGGKDSFLSLTHAIHNSYRIVALCNLHPPLPNQSITTTLDSYMYQTIGHSVLPLYSRALGLPVYRHPIVGKAVDVNLNYHPASSTTNTTTDETEDLYALLSAVKRDFPAIAAVTSGAILSSYQRTRVESVCRRLGLISLAYLWQLPQPSILSALSQLEWDARIVKVAALGMDERWLWWNLADPAVQRRLNVLKMKWGINVAGEGGEFESLVVATPGWRGRIVVED
ncbi:protein E01A2.5, partial [Ascodesmis nigricans]